VVDNVREILSSILISFALCLSLVVMPAGADGDLFSQAYKDTLTVYGNANLDEIIDEDDIEYVRWIIDETEDETQFADANYDGKIDEDDVAQIELIIAGEEDRLVILDMNNRTVTVPMPVERIVSSSRLDSTRTLVQLGAQDKIVGCSYPAPSRSWSPIRYAAPELEDLPDPGSYNDINVELMASLEPDVIFVVTTVNADEIQEKTQVPTIALTSAGDFWVVDMLRIIGAVTGNDEKARDLIAYSKEKVDEIAKITSEIPAEDKPVVYCCGGGWASGDIICKCDGKQPLIEWAGGLNAAESTSSIVVSKEQVIKWNPDVILVHAGNSADIETILSDPALQTINAVKNGRVYFIQIASSGAGVLGAQLAEVGYLAKLFYPDKFEDLDVEKRGNEINEHLYGVDGLYTILAEARGFYRWD